MMHGHEKSRSAIVAVKPTNKAERSAAEPVERRAETKGNADQQRTRRTQRRISVSKMLARIRQHLVAVDTQGGNRMRESCTYGSVRGVRGNSHPYRDVLLLHCISPVVARSERAASRRLRPLLKEERDSRRRSFRAGYDPNRKSSVHRSSQWSAGGETTLTPLT